MSQHSEVCYIPMCTDPNGKQWFAVGFLDWTIRDAKKRFLERDGCDLQAEWNVCRKAGWRIVRVKVSEIKP